jgi:hypothetical protein
MSVYVDDARNPLGRMLMCHMIADSREELLSMASVLGLRPTDIQCEGTYREHFDCCLSKRAMAVKVYGAIEISSRDLLNRMRRRIPHRSDWQTRAALAINEGENYYRQSVLNQGPLPGYPVMEKPT